MQPTHTHAKVRAIKRGQGAG